MPVSHNPPQGMDDTNQKCVSFSLRLSSFPAGAVTYGPRKSLVARWHGIQAFRDIDMSIIRKLDFIRYLQESEMIRLLGHLIFLSLPTPPGPDFDKTCTVITYKRGSCL